MVPLSVHEGSNFSLSSPTLVIFCFCNNDHPNVCEVVSQHGFDLHSSNERCWLIFSYTCCPLLHLLWGNVSSGPLPVFCFIFLLDFLIFFFSSFILVSSIFFPIRLSISFCQVIRVLCIFWLLPLVKYMIPNYFLPYHRFLFTLLIISFDMQKFPKSSLCLFLLFLPVLLGFYPKSLLDPVS